MKKEERKTSFDQIEEVNSNDDEESWMGNGTRREEEGKGEMRNEGACPMESAPVAYPE